MLTAPERAGRAVFLIGLTVVVVAIVGFIAHAVYTVVTDPLGGVF